jgi:hypothetical protein
MAGNPRQEKAPTRRRGIDTTQTNRSTCTWTHRETNRSGFGLGLGTQQVIVSRLAGKAAYALYTGSRHWFVGVRTQSLHENTMNAGRRIQSANRAWRAADITDEAGLAPDDLGPPRIESDFRRRSKSDRCEGRRVDPNLGPIANELLTNNNATSQIGSR